MNRDAFLKAASPDDDYQRRADHWPGPYDLVAKATAILGEPNIIGTETQLPQRVNYGHEFLTQSTSSILQQHVLSDGTQCSLPIRYFEAQCLVATFAAELGRAAELVKGTGLQAIPQEDGMALIKVYCIEYRKTDIGPYNEVGLTVMTMAPGDSKPSDYVLHLPVTTELANRAGREIWGYNKFVAAIDVNSNGKTYLTTLRDTENEMIVTLRGKRDISISIPPTDIVTFSLFKGRLIKTLIQVLTPSCVSSGGGLMVEVGASKHPMTNNLRKLALDGAHPLQVQFTDQFQALLFPGRGVQSD